MVDNYLQIDGAMFDYEEVFSDVVRSLYKGEKLKIVEIGAWLGQSSFYLVEKNHDIAEITIIDRWEGTIGGPSNGQLGAMFPSFQKNMEKWEGKYNTIIGDSSESAKHFEDNSLDFVFIDACHAYDDVCKDINAWMPKVKKGGILAGHDYNIYADVNKAVADLIGDNIEIYKHTFVYRIPSKKAKK